MPDPIQPVAAQIQPPNPNQGIQALSGILGIQQQQQGLQLGQQNIAAGAANLQQTQQRNRELSGVANFTANAMKPGSKYYNSDGSFDFDAYRRDATVIGPVYGREAIEGNITNIKNALETRRTMVGLGKDVTGGISDLNKGLAGRDPVSNPITDQDIFNYRDAARKRIGDDPDGRELLGAHVSQLLATKDPRQRQQIAANTASMLGGFSQQTPGMVNTGAQQFPVTTNQFSGAITPTGQTVNNRLPQTVVTPPGGVPTVIGGASGSATLGGGGAVVGGGGGKGKNLSGFPGVQPTDQDMKNFSDYSGNLSSRIAVAADTVPRLNLVEAAADNIRTGGGSVIRADIARRAQALGMNQGMVDAIAGGNLAQVQEVEKMLFQTTMSGLRQAMQGDPARVAEFQAAERVFPSIDTDPRARQQILGFIRDQSQRDFSEQQALNDARKKGTFNPVTWQADYQQKLRAGEVPGVPESQVPKGRSVTMQQVQDYATKHGLSVDQARAHVTSHGFQISQ